MRGLVRRAILIGLLGGLLGACGSSTPSKSDSGPTRRPDAPPVEIFGIDAGCDEDAMGEDYCIINSPGGNPSVVTRQPVTSYTTCK